MDAAVGLALVLVLGVSSAKAEEQAAASPEAELRKAAELRIEKKTDEALAVLRALAEANSARPEIHSEARYQQGLILEEAGRHQEALASYEAAFSGTPGTRSAPFALLSWARVKEKTGQPGDAIATYDQVLRSYPRYGAVALLRRGEIEEKRGDRLAALNTYRILERNYPRDWEAKAAAAAAVRLCADLTRGSPSTTVMSEVIVQGDCLITENRFEEAEKVYRAALKRRVSPAEKAELLMALGGCYEAQDRIGLAKRTYRRVEKALPRSSHAVAAQMAIVQIHLDRARYGDAVRELKRLVKRHGGSDQAAQAQFMIGSCYESLGETRKAQEAYRQVRKIAPRSPWAFEAQRQLVRLMERGR